MGHVQLEADHEQHQHHANLGEAQGRLRVVHEPEPVGADEHACCQIAEHGAELQPAREWHAHDRGGQIHERALEREVLAHAAASSASRPSTRAR
jgi:hypothetical protein